MRSWMIMRLKISYNHLILFFVVKTKLCSGSVRHFCSICAEHRVSCFKDLSAGIYCSLICQSCLWSVKALYDECSQQTDAKLHHSVSHLVFFPSLCLSKDNMSPDFSISSLVLVDTGTNKPSLNSLMHDIWSVFCLRLFFPKACHVFRHRWTLRNCLTPSDRMW